MPLDTRKNGQIVYDPRGVVETTPIPLGKRVQDLNGLRLGENDYKFAAVNFYEKESFSKNADPALLGEIIGDNDIVLTAIGD